MARPGSSGVLAASYEEHPGCMGSQRSTQGQGMLAAVAGVEEQLWWGVEGGDIEMQVPLALFCHPPAHWQILI